MAGSVGTVGVLALQGGVAEHVALVESLGWRTHLIRTRADLAPTASGRPGGIDALILPGGESTTMLHLLRVFDLTEALADAARSVPTLGTCAGLILLSRLGVLDVDVERNAFGPQVDSATAELGWKDQTVRAAFIRAPAVTRVGEGVRVCSRWEVPLGRRVAAAELPEPDGSGAPSAQASGAVVGVEQDTGGGGVVGISFHPELTGDPTVHLDLLARA